MHPARQYLPELPGVEADYLFSRTLDGGLDDDRRGAVAAVGRAAVDQSLHAGVQAGHVEGPVLHADVDVVGPGSGVRDALLAGEDVPGVAADVVDRLVLLQKLYGSVDFSVSCAYSRSVLHSRGENQIIPTGVVDAAFGRVPAIQSCGVLPRDTGDPERRREAGEKPGSRIRQARMSAACPT